MNIIKNRAFAALAASLLMQASNARADDHAQHGDRGHGDATVSTDLDGFGPQMMQCAVSDAKVNPDGSVTLSSEGVLQVWKGGFLPAKLSLTSRLEALEWEQFRLRSPFQRKAWIMRNSRSRR